MEQINPIQPPVAANRFDLKKSWPLLAGSFLVVVAGVLTAWLISTKVMGVKTGSSVAAPGAKVTSSGAGVLDPKIKYDEATGTLVAGGLNNEGTHHLERDGGPSKSVYLTSSVIDLESFVGKKIQIWGETMASKKVGWLMDVAKVQVQ